MPLWSGVNQAHSSSIQYSNLLGQKLPCGAQGFAVIRLSGILLQAFLQCVTCTSYWTAKRKNERLQRCVHLSHISCLSVGSHASKGKARPVLVGATYVLEFLVVLGRRKNASTSSEANCGSNLSAQKQIFCKFIWPTCVHIYMYRVTDTRIL